MSRIRKGPHSSEGLRTLYYIFNVELVFGTFHIGIVEIKVPMEAGVFNTLDLLAGTESFTKDGVTCLS